MTDTWGDDPIVKGGGASDWGNDPIVSKPQSASAGPAMPAATSSFPYDKPGTVYGDVLPVSRDTATGKMSLAVPEMIRAPLRGAAEWGSSMLGHGPVRPGDTQPTPDMMAATMALGGLRGSPGEASVGATLPPSRLVSKSVADAHGAGYVLPPAMAGKPGPITNALSGWAGKTKLQQSASVANQEVTNRLATQSLGLPEETTLNESVLHNVREEAGKAYAKVAQATPVVVPDEAFHGTIGALGGRTSHAAKYFPQLMDNEQIKSLSEELGSVNHFSPQAGLELVKELRFNANANLKAPGDPGKHALGLAQRQAADAVDDLMERNISKADEHWGDRFDAATSKESAAAKAVQQAKQKLTSFQGKLATNSDIYVSADAMRGKRAAEEALERAQKYLDSATVGKEAARTRLQQSQAERGKDDLVNEYREARRQIAKSYDIEGAMNPATGDVNALGIAKLAAKGRPLTGELDTIANAANAFPRALQNVSRFGGEENHSALDFFGSALAISHGDPGLAAAIIGRPAVRSALLSKPVQSRMATQPKGREPMLPQPIQAPPWRIPGTAPYALPGATAGNAADVNEQLGGTP